MWGRKPPPRGRNRAYRDDDDSTQGGSKRGGLLETVIMQPGRALQAGRSRRSGAAELRLVDLAAEWLATISALRSARELSNAEMLRERMLELKARFEQRARQAGIPAADIESASFAIVAFLDETVISKPGGARTAWAVKPLADEFTRVGDAGEVFHKRLDQLRSERRVQVLEVCYCCLAFGFDGGLEPGKLAPLIKELERTIASLRGTGQSPLAPHSSRPDDLGTGTGGKVPVWLSLAVFFPATMLAWLVIALLAHQGARSVAHQIQALPR